MRIAMMHARKRRGVALSDNDAAIVDRLARRHQSRDRHAGEGDEESNAEVIVLAPAPHRARRTNGEPRKIR